MGEPVEVRPPARPPYTLAGVPVVCLRLSEEALVAMEEKARRRGQDKSSWLRGLVLKDLGMDRASTEVEAVITRPPTTIDPLVPGDTITVLEPHDPRLPPGAIRP